MLLNVAYPKLNLNNYFTLKDTINRLFDTYFGNEPVFNFSNSMLKYNLVDQGNELLYTFEVPGIPKDDIKLTILGDNLTISGERKAVEIQSDARLIKNERFPGFFSRTFRIPCEVDHTKVNAEYQNGILSVKLAKSEKAKPKEISINVK